MSNRTMVHGSEAMNGGASADHVDGFRKGKDAAINLLWNLDKGDALRASFQLRIPDILAKAESEDGKSGLSAEEIVQRLKARTTPGSPEVAQNLKRLLEPLVQDGVYKRTRGSDGKAVYSITDLSRWFVADNKSNILGPAGFQFSAPYRKAVEIVESAVLDDSQCPFEAVNGASFYEYTAKNPQFETLMSSTMTGFTNLEVPELLEAIQQSCVLRGAKTVVDVGGRVGSFIAHIVAGNPEIHGINFDMGQVLNVPEAAPGVEHVAGSFFEKVPAGDVMILKAILHNYGDGESVKILRKCFEALPQHGKVLIIEYVLPGFDERSPGYGGKMAVGMDFSMLVNFPAGRERSLEEYDELLTAVRFSGTTIISRPGCMGIILANKD